MPAASSATSPHFPDLLALVERILRESGDPERSRDVDPAAWLDAWLTGPAPVFGGRPPAAFLDTPEGAERVRAVLASMQTGAYW